VSTKKTITEEMVKDIKNGISAEDYAKKYNLSKCSFYNHMQSVFPELVKK
jgi:Mor family transcriptional regulator